MRELLGEIKESKLPLKGHCQLIVKKHKQDEIVSVGRPEVEVEAVPVDLRLRVNDQVLWHNDDQGVLGLARPPLGQGRVGLGVVREEHLTEEGQDHLGLAATHL